jgi:hypothetical protein
MFWTFCDGLFSIALYNTAISAFFQLIMALTLELDAEKQLLGGKALPL